MEDKNWDFEINLNNCNLERNNEGKPKMLKCKIIDAPNKSVSQESGSN